MSFFSRDKRTPYEKARDQVGNKIIYFYLIEIIFSQKKLVAKFDEKKDN